MFLSISRPERSPIRTSRIWASMKSKKMKSSRDHSSENLCVCEVRVRSLLVLKICRNSKLKRIRSMFPLAMLSVISSHSLIFHLRNPSYLTRALNRYLRLNFAHFSRSAAGIRSHKNRKKNFGILNYVYYAQIFFIMFPLPMFPLPLESYVLEWEGLIQKCFEFLGHETESHSKLNCHKVLRNGNVCWGVRHAKDSILSCQKLRTLRQHQLLQVTIMPTDRRRQPSPNRRVALTVKSPMLRKGDGLGLHPSFSPSTFSHSSAELASLFVLLDHKLPSLFQIPKLQWNWWFLITVDAAQKGKRFPFVRAKS